METTFIIQKIEKLSETHKIELSRFIDSLIEQEKTEKKPRIAGFLKGSISISEDFDEPLEDFKDYM